MNGPPQVATKRILGGRLIESLLQRPEFVDYWSYKWGDLFLVNSDKLPVQSMWSYYQWIRGNVELNTPWDEMVRDLLGTSIPIAGMYCLGEIAPMAFPDRTQFHNATMVSVLLGAS